MLLAGYPGEGSHFQGDYDHPTSNSTVHFFQLQLLVHWFTHPLGVAHFL